MCIPHLYRDKINILSHTGRFALSEAEGLVDQVRSMCQQRGRALDPVWDFLIRRSLGRAYLEYGNLSKASRVLEVLLGDLHRIPQLGLIHKTLFINAYAKLLRQQGCASEWQEALKLALRIADDTEVTSEFAVMRESLGPTMGPLLKDLHLLPTGETAQEEQSITLAHP